MDYQKHFKLNESPFKSARDWRFYFKRAGVQRILEAVGADDCPPLVHLKGVAGAGKTVFLQRLPVDLRETHKVALILNPHLKFSEILRQGLNDFGRSHKFDPHTPEEALLGFFQNAVTDYIEGGFRVLLAMDNAQELPPETLGELENLCALEPQWAGRMVLLLCGRPDQPWPLSLDIATPALELELVPLSDEEVEKYLAQRLRAAGGELCWGRPALKRLAEYSRGLPELINQLAERAMIAAWSARLAQVKPRHVKAAKTSLDNPLTYTPDAASAVRGGQVAPPPERGAPGQLRNRSLLLCMALAFLAAVWFWKMAPRAVPAPPPESGPALEAPAEPAETATPAADNPVTEESGVLAPALPSPPPQLLRLPQGSPVMVIDLDSMKGRLWQGAPRGAGLKAEVALPDFSERGLYLFGRPHGQNTLVFQYPPARDIPLAEARALWPRIATLLPQNMLPVIIGRGRDFAKGKDEALEAAIADRVKAWVQSQQYKFADSTAELYDATFQFFELGQEPRSVKRDDFRAALHSESSTAGEVNLTVSQPLIMQDPAKSGIVWAVFHLRYESKLRHDMGTRVLVFEKAVLTDTWLIVAELWLPEKSLRGD